MSKRRKHELEDAFIGAVVGVAVGWIAWKVTRPAPAALR